MSPGCPLSARVSSGPSFLPLTVIFIYSQVKDLIMVVKFWRNAADWNERKWRPTSYLLALLLVRAYENACHVVEGSLPSNKTVMKSFVKLILSTGNPR